MLKYAAPLFSFAALAACACGPATEAGGIPEYTYEMVHTYPHDRDGVHRGALLSGRLPLRRHRPGGALVRIRKVKLETGEVLQKRDVPSQYFGEGIVVWKDRLLELTWKAEKGFIYDLATFDAERRLPLPRRRLGSYHRRQAHHHGATAPPRLRFWDPETLKETGRITVTEDGTPPVPESKRAGMGEGRNLCQCLADRAHRAHRPQHGQSGGLDRLPRSASPLAITPPLTDVLNGIAYDAKGDRLFVTGKRWPKLFEIKLIKRTQ